MKYQNVVWDWNGTLLDDVQTGVDTLNDMLKRRGIPQVSVQQYKDLFGFPVEDFYRKVGFDLNRESMHTISVDFVETYDRYGQEIQLNVQVWEVLESLQQLGIRQYILSALREDLLQKMIRDFAIDKCFERACGSDNIYAAGKVERGQRMLESCDICPEETLMIGDTVHDAEVARALGFACILYTGGHNSEWRLREQAPVIRQMEEVIERV